MKRSNGKYRFSTKDAISNAQEQYTKCGVFCPGTFTPVPGLFGLLVMLERQMVQKG
jgi:hypothetical protein